MSRAEFVCCDQHFAKKETSQKQKCILLIVLESVNADNHEEIAKTGSNKYLRYVHWWIRQTLKTNYIKRLNYLDGWIILGEPFQIK